MNLIGFHLLTSFLIMFTKKLFRISDWSEKVPLPPFIPLCNQDTYIGGGFQKNKSFVQVLQ